MKVIVEKDCPFCHKKLTCVRFRVHETEYPRLTLYCSTCKITGIVKASTSTTENGEIKFFKLTDFIEIVWEKTGFNPSER